MSSFKVQCVRESRARKQSDLELKWKGKANAVGLGDTCRKA